MSGFWSGASFALSFLAYGGLAVAIVRQQQLPPATRPRLLRATWLMLALVDLALALSASADTAAQMWAYVAGSTPIALYVLSKGRSGWEREDKQTLALTTTALLVWALTHTAAAADVFLLVAIGIGAWPLVRSLWHNRGAYGVATWLLFWLGGLAGLCAITKWSIETALAPCGIFLCQSLILWLSLPFPKRPHQGQAAPERATKPTEAPLAEERFRTAA